MSVQWRNYGTIVSSSATPDLFGHSTAMSDDASVMIVGAPYSSIAGNSSGTVKVYVRTGAEWVQRGQDLHGVVAAHNLGRSVSISADGNTICMSGVNYKGGTIHVMNYDSVNDIWVPKGVPVADSGGAQITGEADEKSGWSVSMNADGTIIATGCPFYVDPSNTGYYLGRAKVFMYDAQGDTWVPMGQFIQTVTNDTMGFSVAINNAGDVLAVGSPQKYDATIDGTGYVSVYTYDASANMWTQLGQTLVGDGTKDFLGETVALNAAGTILAAGAIGEENTPDRGYAKVFQYDASAQLWVQMGITIMGEGEGDWAGASLSLNAEGNIFSLGAQMNDPPGSLQNAGHVRVFRYVDTEWRRLGVDIDGVNLDNQSGSSVSLSADGKKLVSGIPVSRTVKTFEFPSVATLKAEGYTITQILAGGYLLPELRFNGFVQTEFRDASFSVVDLKNAGFSVAELLEAMYTLDQLNNHGFTRAEYEDALVTINDLKNAQFTLLQLKDLGYTAVECCAAGFTIAELKSVSFSDVEILTAGYTATDLLLNNYTSQEVRMYYTDTQVLDAVEAINVDPSPPVINNVVAGDQSMFVHFSDASNANVLILGYKYVLNGSPTMFWALNNVSPMEIKGLTNGQTYSISLFAVTATSMSGASNVVSGVAPSGVPLRPLLSNLTSFEDDVFVDIDVDTNGSPVLQYYYSLDGENYVAADVSGNTLRVFDLSNNLPVSITAKVENANGMSASSNMLSTVVPRLPEAPTIVQVVPGNASCVVEVNDGNNYNSPVICYKYKLSGDETIYTAIKENGAIHIPNIVNYQTYTVQVQTVCVVGSSPFSSASDPFMSIGAPNAIVLAKVEPRNNAIYVEFTDPNDALVNVTGYKYSLNNSALVDLGTLELHAIISTGVVNSAEYIVALYAVNDRGTSAKSNVLTCVPGTPTPPILHSAEDVDDNLVIHYSFPTVMNTTGLTKMAYTLDGGLTLVEFSKFVSPFVISGLPRAQVFSVGLVAYNRNGRSQVSNLIETSIVSVPTRPVITSFVLEYETPTTCVGHIHIQTPTGHLPTGYKYQLNQSGIFLDASGGTTMPLTLVGLQSNRFVVIRVVAVNSIGESEPSVPVTAMFYQEVPSVPIVSMDNIVLTSGNMSISFAPPSDNGSPITTYKYSLNDASFVDLNSNVLPLNVPIQNNVSYNVRIVATNALGDSTPSAPLSRPVMFTRLVPIAPTIRYVLGADQSLEVHFIQSITRGAPVTSYSYELTGGMSATVDTASTTSPIIIPGLTNGTSYSVRLFANSAAGVSSFSNQVTRSPILDRPSAPIVLKAEARNNACIVTLDTPSPNGSPITAYLFSLNNGAAQDLNQLTTQLTVPGLINNVPNHIRIYAVNALGTSNASSVITVTPVYAVPSSPTIAQLRRGVKQLTVSFTLPANNAAPITNVYYSLDNGATKVPCNKLTSPIVISNLVTGQSYSVTLYAQNEVGFSLASNAMTAVVL